MRGFRWERERELHLWVSLVCFFKQMMRFETPATEKLVAALQLRQSERDALSSSLLIQFVNKFDEAYDKYSGGKKEFFFAAFFFPLPPLTFIQISWSRKEYCRSGLPTISCSCCGYLLAGASAKLAQIGLAPDLEAKFNLVSLFFSLPNSVLSTNCSLFCRSLLLFDCVLSAPASSFRKINI